MDGKKQRSLEALVNIWNDQKQFNKNFIDFKELDNEKRIEETKEYALQLIDETLEFIRETNWKNHRKQNINIIRSNMLEEAIDIFKYWLSIMVLWGFNPEEIVDEYKRKSAVVEQRFKQEKQLDFESNKIAGVDIDGVLAAYPEHFVNFINKRMGTDYKVSEIKEYNMKKAFKELPDGVIGELKDEFRQSGEKRYIPVLPGAKKFLEILHRKGFKIVLLSARPYKKYKRIFADTQEWLDKNDLIHDAILWDEDKCNRLIREFGKDNVSFFVEDNLNNANSIAKVSKVYLINRPYNQGNIEDSVVRINNLSNIEEIKEAENV